MQVDYLIIGQGLSGTWISFYLQQAGQSFHIIDENKPFTASKVASGIINPVTGRRIVKTWMIDELLPFARQAYQAIGNQLQFDCITEKKLIECFPTPQIRLAFSERYQKDQEYLAMPEYENDWQPYLQYDFGYGIVHPCFLVDVQGLLGTYRKQLLDNVQLREAYFEPSSLRIKEDVVQYKDIEAKKIIFCDGVSGFDNPFFRNLPFGLNKGEALLVHIPDLPATHIFKKGFSLVPWKESIFWMGSTYLWEFDNPHPTKGFYQFGENWLNQTLRIPFNIVDHLAAIRPATLERRPFVGLHPDYNAMGILNGMGTKGCSLAPYFANQLVNHLINGSPIQPEVDVQRFKKVLSR